MLLSLCSGGEGHRLAAALDLGAMHDATRVAVERVAAMHGRAVVPHHKVAQTPRVLIEAARLGDVRPQRLEQGVGLFARQALDIGIAPPSEIERGASIGGMT